MKTRAIRDVPGESVPPNGTDFFERRGEEAAAEGVPVANSTSETALRPGTRGAAGGYAQRPMERGRNCVERNRQRAGAGRERSGAESPREPGSPGRETFPGMGPKCRNNKIFIRMLSILLRLWRQMPDRRKSAVVFLRHGRGRDVPASFPLRPIPIPARKGTHAAGRRRRRTP